MLIKMEKGVFSLPLLFFLFLLSEGFVQRIRNSWLRRWQGEYPAAQPTREFPVASMNRDSDGTAGV